MLLGPLTDPLTDEDTVVEMGSGFTEGRTVYTTQTHPFHTWES